MHHYQLAADFIRSRLPDDKPIEIGIILGSGLGGLGDKLSDVTVIPYGDIPDFAASTAPGHKGNLLAGTIAGRGVIIECPSN